MEKHQRIAIGIYLTVIELGGLRGGLHEAMVDGIILLPFLLAILFYRLIAYFSGFGFPEYFARDFGSDNHPGPYAFFFWLLFLITCALLVFEWRLY